MNANDKGNIIYVSRIDLYSQDRWLSLTAELNRLIKKKAKDLPLLPIYPTDQPERIRDK